MFKFHCLIFILFSHSLYGLTTLTVSLSTDNDAGGQGQAGDLRYCLNTMNTQLNGGADNYAIVFSAPMTIELNGTLPLINNSSNAVNITIGNPGSTPTVTLDGQNLYSGFLIPIGSVTIQNMTFQNLIAQGGTGGNGISGGGGGLGAGAAIYAPASFLNNGSAPEITLSNVVIQNCSAIGGNGGSYIGNTSTGDEGGGGGGGFGGNGGSIVTTGSTGGGGGGGCGGNGGDVTLSANADPVHGGAGGGGGGLGSRAGVGAANLGNGGTDVTPGSNGNGYGLLGAGAGGGGYAGGSNGGGGGGGALVTAAHSGGGGGGSAGGSEGNFALGNMAPGGGVMPSAGQGADGGGGGGGAIVTTSGAANDIDGQGGGGGYGGGGGGGAGSGAFGAGYTVLGGLGGVGGGGGGGGVNQSGMTTAEGGSSKGGGGGGGGGPSNGSVAQGGQDSGNLGGGAGGNGTTTYGVGFGGGGGGGGSGLGGAIFVDSGLSFTIQAFPAVTTTFSTADNSVARGIAGMGAPGSSASSDGSALGPDIFLRTGSTLNLVASDVDDLLILDEGVTFVDDTSFGTGGSTIEVKGNGTVIYNGTSDYAGEILINNANFQVNGVIDTAQIFVCRNLGFSLQRGTLSGTGTLTGDVYVNSGTLAPQAAEALTLGGNLTLNSADPADDTLGSLVHIEIDGDETSLVSVGGPASLAGVLEIDLDPDAVPGAYTILTSTGITGTFDSITFTGDTPRYSLSYLPLNAPTFVQFDYLGPINPVVNLQAPSNLQGTQKKNDFGLEYELYNQLTWTRSSSATVVSYLIYRDGNKIATVDASVSTYLDHNQPPGVSSLYSVVAYDGASAFSPSVTVLVKGR